MNLRAIAVALGGEVHGGQVLAPGPGHSPQDRSLAVRFSGDDFVVHSFCGDDPLRCKDYVRERLGLPQWAPGDGRERTIPPHKRAAWDRSALDREAGEGRPMTEDDLIRIKRAVDIWNEAAEPRGTLAEAYLRRHRKLDLPDDLAGAVLRFHPRCPWRDESIGRTVRIPALIAAFRSIDDDAITAIHRIALKPDGTKLDRKMLGFVRRSAVKLDPTVGKELLIGEGVETCMAARQLGLKPAWALGSVGMISFFPVLDGVRRLLIHGESGAASAEAIKLCGRRWSRAGRRVQIIYSEVGADFNDALMELAQ